MFSNRIQCPPYHEGRDDDTMRKRLCEKECKKGLKQSRESWNNSSSLKTKIRLDKNNKEQISYHQSSEASSSYWRLRRGAWNQQSEKFISEKARHQPKRQQPVRLVSPTISIEFCKSLTNESNSTLDWHALVEERKGSYN